jgi:hypothetical protein
MRLLRYLPALLHVSTIVRRKASEARKNGFDGFPGALLPRGDLLLDDHIDPPGNAESPR